MAEYEFTGADLEQLSGKLDAIGDQLSERDRTLLLAVFQLAGDKVQSEGSEVEGFGAQGVASNPTYRFAAAGAGVPRLSDGFRGSFRPGANRGLWAAGGEDASVGVTVGVMF